jgi:hypothetical protein
MNDKNHDFTLDDLETTDWLWLLASWVAGTVVWLACAGATFVDVLYVLPVPHTKVAPSAIPFAVLFGLPSVLSAVTAVAIWSLHSRDFDLLVGVVPSAILTVLFLSDFVREISGMEAVAAICSGVLGAMIGTRVERGIASRRGRTQRSCGEDEVRSERPPD